MPEYRSQDLQKDVYDEIDRILRIPRQKELLLDLCSCKWNAN